MGKITNQELDSSIQVGELSNLNTENKNSLIEAINEVVDDINNINLIAENVIYDNIQSGLLATNVQSAIDELNSGKAVKPTNEATATDGQVLTYEYEAPLINPRKGEIERRLQDIRVELQQTDYKAIKYAEGIITDAEYSVTRDARQALRNEYNALEIEYETCPEYLPE